ncbi:VOC family protein [Winogradskya consettensis]
MTPRGPILVLVATHWTICFDAAEPQRIAAFWAAALGYTTEPGFDGPDAASIIDPRGAGPAISFLRVPEPKAAKNRLHVDIRPGGDATALRAKAAELVTLGATVVREEHYGEHLGHIVLLDPERNEFCVA